MLVTFPWGAPQNEQPLVNLSPNRVLGKGFDDARDVANTLFPKKTWDNSSSRSDFYQRYLRAHARSRNKRWGTYFQRLISFGSSQTNQLERVMYALTNWERSYAAAMVMHTSSAETDKIRPLGSPCLQYIQLSCPNSEVINMTAVYRNHDFCNKALGNYFGLGRLLTFVASETGRQSGQISVLSVHAYFETSQKRMKELLQVV